LLLDRDPEETARVRRLDDLINMEDDMDAFFSSMVSRDDDALPEPPEGPII
jgi:hypothetical protein